MFLKWEVSGASASNEAKRGSCHFFWLAIPCEKDFFSILFIWYALKLLNSFCSKNYEWSPYSLSLYWSTARWQMWMIWSWFCDSNKESSFSGQQLWKMVRIPYHLREISSKRRSEKYLLFPKKKLYFQLWFGAVKNEGNV